MVLRQRQTSGWRLLFCVATTWALHGAPQRVLPDHVRGQRDTDELLAPGLGLPGDSPYARPEAPWKKKMLPVNKGHQQELLELASDQFASGQPGWVTYVAPDMALVMTRPTKRQKRAGRKQVKIIFNQRCLADTEDGVQRNKKRCFR